MFDKVSRLKIALLKLFLDLKPVLFKKQAFTAHVENLNFHITLQPTDRNCPKITGETGISIQEVKYRNAVLWGINNIYIFNPNLKRYYYYLFTTEITAQLLNASLNCQLS